MTEKNTAAGHRLDADEYKFLRALVDKLSLADVIDAIGDITNDKANETNSLDLAEEWMDIGQKLELLWLEVDL